MEKKLAIGGQAVIEGVMIRTKNYNVVACRTNNKIKIKKDKLAPRKGFYQFPIIRGFFNLADMLVWGMRSLTWSAEQQTSKEEKISKTEMTVTVLFSIGLAILLFVALPYFFTIWSGIKEESQPLLFNFIDGLIRISIFLLYLLGISLLKDVKVLFQYHGAEHMAIHCFEHGKKLTVDNVKRFTTLHPRCGTAFIMIVMVVAILVFSIMTPIILALLPGLAAMATLPQKIILFFIRLLFLPLIAGLSYEFLKFSAKYEKKAIMRVFVAPGLLMQKITTKKPTAKQIEVAIRSMETALKLEKIKF